MPDFDPRRLDALSPQLEGLAAAAAALSAEPDVGVSVRRIARSLQSAAESIGASEVAAGATAIQRATDAQLSRSVGNFLERIGQIRGGAAAGPARVLVVEDNKTIAAATAAYLSGPERDVRVVATAAEAEAALATGEVDVVVLDLILPDRDGRDLLVRLREDARTAALPVVVLSAQGGAVARTECLAVGADDFMEKPADPKALRAAVTRVLRSAAGRSDPVRDALTGLPNRAGLTAAYRAGAADGGRTGVPVSVVGVSLLALAPVRRALGPEAADRYLVELASGIAELLGPGVVVGCWERAELVALLTGRSPAQARACVEAALARVTNGPGLSWLRDAGIETAYAGRLAAARPDAELREVLVAADPCALETGTSFTRGAPGAPIPAPVPFVPRPRRILVVEDDRVTATLLHHRLVRDGYEVKDFLNGEDAYAWALEEPFDLAILDVKVPGMDGFELLERLRGIERLADVPIVMLTGMGRESDVIRGLELGANDYMLKPFSPTELLARVRRLLLGGPVGAPSGSPSGEAGAP